MKYLVAQIGIYENSLKIEKLIKAWLAMPKLGKQLQEERIQIGFLVLNLRMYVIKDYILIDSESFQPNPG